LGLKKCWKIRGHKTGKIGCNGNNSTNQRKRETTKGESGGGQGIGSEEGKKKKGSGQARGQKSEIGVRLGETPKELVANRCSRIGVGN